MMITARKEQAKVTLMGRQHVISALACLLSCFKIHSILLLLIRASAILIMMDNLRNPLNYICI